MQQFFLALAHTIEHGVEPMIFWSPGNETRVVLVTAIALIPMGDWCGTLESSEKNGIFSAEEVFFS
ncbi:MAG: hypothetical protein U9N47_04335 [Thermodesulfobacteriota bacterium]|nr:hypothetical protein [Thermodesulfobacteriota bacterium]